MTLSPGGRRAISWAAVSLVLPLIWSLWPDANKPVAVAASVDSVSFGERQLAKLREAAATIPKRQQALKQASADLDQREKGLIVADTAQQAQAQMIQILRKVGQDENPRVDIRSQEMGAVRPFGDAYGEVLVTVQIICGIDQLVNMLVELGKRPELIASNEIRVTSTSPKDKSISVRLTISGIVPRKLVPVKKGLGAS